MPSDAVVSVLDEVVPGQLLEKLMLVGCLVAAGIGTARLVRPGPGATFARIVAVTLVTWNPFVVERLVIGHWPVLVGYGVLPWLIAAAPALAAGGPPAAAAVAARPARQPERQRRPGDRGRRCSPSRSPVVGRGAGSARSVLLALANAPWVVAGLLHAPTAVSDASGAESSGFPARARCPRRSPRCRLGGIWNSEVVPVSRTGFQAWVALVFLVTLVAVGARSWWRHEPRRDAWAFVGCWVVGMVVALATWAAPDAVAWLVEEVPGAGLFRDGSRTLALCAPITVLVAAEGARLVWRGLAAPPVLRFAVGATLVVLPLALMPDAAWGVDGRLRPVDYPASWATARDVVEDAHAASGGDVLVLPLTSYRAAGLARRRQGARPDGSLPHPELRGSRRPGRLRRAGRRGRTPGSTTYVVALALPTPPARAEALAALGIGYVVLEPDAFGPAPEIAGEVLLDRPDVRVTALDDVQERDAPAGWIVALTLAWLGFVGCVVVGAVAVARAARGPARDRADNKFLRNPTRGLLTAIVSPNS